MSCFPGPFQYQDLQIQWLYHKDWFVYFERVLCSEAAANFNKKKGQLGHVSSNYILPDKLADFLTYLLTYFIYLSIFYYYYLFIYLFIYLYVWWGGGGPKKGLGVRDNMRKIDKRWRWGGGGDEERGMEFYIEKMRVPHSYPKRCTNRFSEPAGWFLEDDRLGRGLCLWGWLVEAVCTRKRWRNLWQTTKWIT